MKRLVEFSQSVRDEVRERAGDRCEVCKARPIGAFHHRRLRSQGGLGTVENCLAVCDGFGSCHRWIHDHPAKSYELGYLLHAWDDMIVCASCKQPQPPIEFGESGYCDQCSRDALDDPYGQADALRGDE